MGRGSSQAQHMLLAARAQQTAMPIIGAKGSQGRA
jgi:hypothetical protein